MSKGLSIARAFYREGHNVIGADFEPNGVPVCGRFSTALKKFYRLSKPFQRPNGSNPYIEGILNIIQEEGVELWVTCSGVASAIEDAEAAVAVEQASNCKVIQFGVKVTQTLHEKHSFIQQAKTFGLHVPETHYISSLEDAMAELHPQAEKKHVSAKKFIMKSIGLDDSIRADMTLLPRPSSDETLKHLLRLNPSSSRPFVLQQFINGREYCTHSIVVNGSVVAFTACLSAELLMHYKSLSPQAALYKAMQEYTQIYARKLGHVTGHFSIDFMLDGDESGPELMKRLSPIECNPRAHTAVVLFEQESEGMAEAYLSVLGDSKTDLKKTASIIIPQVTTGYYWIGHDIITRLLLPLLLVFTLKMNLFSLQGNLLEFMEHALYWKDGTYEVWDPWPFWWLYCVYWPGMFISAIVTGNWWSRCNVSTTKLFRC